MNIKKFINKTMKRIDIFGKPIMLSYDRKGE